jgi:hypothetical protein
VSGLAPRMPPRELEYTSLADAPKDHLLRPLLMTGVVPGNFGPPHVIAAG